MATDHWCRTVIFDAMPWWSDLWRHGIVLACPRCGRRFRLRSDNLGWSAWHLTRSWLARKAVTP